MKQNYKANSGTDSDRNGPGNAEAGSHQGLLYSLLGLAGPRRDALTPPSSCPSVGFKYQRHYRGEAFGISSDHLTAEDQALAPDDPPVPETQTGDLEGEALSDLRFRAREHGPEDNNRTIPAGHIPIPGVSQQRVVFPILTGPQKRPESSKKNAATDPIPDPVAAGSGPLPLIESKRPLDHTASARAPGEKLRTIPAEPSAGIIGEPEAWPLQNGSTESLPLPSKIHSVPEKDRLDLSPENFTLKEAATKPLLKQKTVPRIQTGLIRKRPLSSFLGETASQPVQKLRYENPRIQVPVARPAAVSKPMARPMKLSSIADHILSQKMAVPVSKNPSQEAEPEPEKPARATPPFGSPGQLDLKSGETLFPQSQPVQAPGRRPMVIVKKTVGKAKMRPAFWERNYSGRFYLHLIR